MFKFIYRFVKHLSILLFISLPLQLVGMLILLVLVPLFPGRRQLPKLFRWFDNADQYLDRDTSRYFEECDKGDFAKYYWLALRNPCNYFGYKVLGFQADQDTPLTNSNPKISGHDIGDGFDETSGLFTASLKEYYEYYWIYRYGKSNKCFRFRMGWKIGQDNLKIGEYIEQVFVISPFHSFDGV